MSEEAKKPVVAKPTTKPLEPLTLDELELVVGGSPGRVTIN